MLYVYKSFSNIILRDIYFTSEFFSRVVKYLSFGFVNKSGRNNFGRITVFSKGGGFFKKYRILDLKRVLVSEGFVASLERDWNRTGLISCIIYYIGLCTYILASDSFYISKPVCGFGNDIVNSSGFMSWYTVGKRIYNIEFKPGFGGGLARAAGTSVFMYNNYKTFVVIKLKSGILKKISGRCIGSLGCVSNRIHKFGRKRNAGVSRLLGKRPIVRGVVMNPVDHPHGGGEGKKSNPCLPRNPWGKSLRKK